MNGIIYDLDGVIVDTTKYHYLGWKKLADQLGVEFDEKRNEKLKGLSRRDSLLALLGRVPEEAQVREWCDRKNRYYLESVQGISARDLLPGASRLLAAVKEARDWKQALASSSRNARLILKKLGIGEYFDVVVDGSDVEKAKPDPAIFLAAARKLGLGPDLCVVAEDAESGIMAARKAGMRTIGVGRKEVLQHADIVVSDLSALDPDKLRELFRIPSGPVTLQEIRGRR